VSTIIEKPMLFSGPMVRAILEGRKTQTRRIVKLNDSGHIKEVGGNRRWRPDDQDVIFACPNPVGSRIWVKETWREHMDNIIIYSADKKTREGIECKDPINVKWRPSIHMPRWASRITLEVTDVCVQRLQDITEDDALSEGIYSELVSTAAPLYSMVRYVAPGVPMVNAKGDKEDHAPTHLTAIDAFEALWKHINGYDNWYTNPWVWAYTFKVVKP